MNALVTSLNKALTQTKTGILGREYVFLLYLGEYTSLVHAVT